MLFFRRNFVRWLNLAAPEGYKVSDYSLFWRAVDDEVNEAFETGDPAFVKETLVEIKSVIANHFARFARPNPGETVVVYPGHPLAGFDWKTAKNGPDDPCGIGDRHKQRGPEKNKAFNSVDGSRQSKRIPVVMLTETEWVEPGGGRLVVPAGSIGRLVDDVGLELAGNPRERDAIIATLKHVRGEGVASVAIWLFGQVRVVERSIIEIGDRRLGIECDSANLTRKPTAWPMSAKSRC
jgi:hypothetical protein